ncbi:MAG: hypothetical protein DRO15_06985 [Thermoprotei archaeon]|nr:MAG: hypothetical protein DRO15_06985 [Thermoprotei archaeon]
MVSFAYPRCGAKLTYNHRLAICRKCGFITDRDIIGAINIYLKTLKHVAPRLGSWSTHPMTNETRAKGGLYKHEPMIIHIHLYTNI